VVATQYSPNISGEIPNTQGDDLLCQAELVSLGSENGGLIRFTPGAISDAEVIEDLHATPVDQGGFDEFYKSHRDEIGRALAFTLGDTGLAEEAVDEAMARAYQRWSSVGAYDSPAGWVYRAGLNWGRSWKRSAFRRQRREEKVAVPEMGIPAPSSGESSYLFDALAQLPIKQRSVVVLRHYCDWSVEETAAALDISEGTVKSRSARALAQLRTTLAKEVEQ